MKHFCKIGTLALAFLACASIALAQQDTLRQPKVITSPLDINYADVKNTGGFQFSSQPLSITSTNMAIPSGVSLIDLTASGSNTNLVQFTSGLTANQLYIFRNAGADLLISHGAGKIVNTSAADFTLKQNGIVLGVAVDSDTIQLEVP